MTIRQVFRPLGAPSPLIWATDWRTISQATPNTVPPANPNYGNGAYSNAESSYDSTTLGKKLIIKYEKQWKITEPEPILYLGEQYSDGGAKIRYVAPGAVATGELQLAVRVRAIIADWDPATITWNNYAASLSIGDLIHYSLPLQHWVSGWGGQSYESYLGAMTPGVLRINYPSSQTIHGILLDVMPTADSPGQYNSRYAQYYWMCNVSNALKPYVFMPA